MSRVLCIGELLVDFFTTEINESLSEAKLFVKKAGGAPANVCAAVTRLGGDARFCGKVGADPFGDFLEQTLIQYGVDTRYLMKSTQLTTLAFVTRQQGGERDFVFQRGADGDVEANDLAQFTFEEEVAHFGSATALLKEPFRSSYIQLMHELKAQGTFISFDPNFREALWAGQEAIYFECVKQCVRIAHFVKMSAEEYEMLVQMLKLEGQIVSDVSSAIFAVTLGEQGTRLLIGDTSYDVPSITVKSIDTTGAGDAFVGALLYQLADVQLKGIREAIIAYQKAQLPLSQSNVASILNMVKKANIVGALTCTQIGAMDAIPTLDTVDVYQL